MSIWTEVSENVWATEHSTLAVARSPRTVPVDGILYEDLEWREIHSDPNGPDRELMQWEARSGRFTFIIFND